MTEGKSTRASQRATGVRSALVLMVTALASFGGVVLARYSGSPEVGFGAFGLVLVGFLLAAMTRP